MTDSEGFRNSPPIDSPFLRRQKDAKAGPIDLGFGVRIERLDDRLAELIFSACSPRGHYFAPFKQFGQRYSIVRPVPVDEYENAPYAWDGPGLVWDALTLSRLVRDNAYSTQYAARVVDFADGEQVISYTLSSESKHVYRLRQDREWLSADEGGELAALLKAHRQLSEPPPRLRLAMWRAEYASWMAWGDLTNTMLVSGLEALLKTERHKATRQFSERVSALAEELFIPGLDREQCADLYSARSEWIHGAHVRLASTGQEANEQARETREHLTLPPEFGPIARLQDVLRAAIRRCLLDSTFLTVFQEDAAIRSRWPVA